MSGAEVPGLVLAGPPLLISCLEHLHDLHRMIGTMKDFRRVHRRYMTQANLLEVAFSQTMEILFLPIVEDVDHLERLKTRPDDPEWRHMEVKLKSRLNHSAAQAFIEAVADVRDRMEELKDKLVSTCPQNARDAKNFCLNLLSGFQHERHRCRLAVIGTPLREAFDAVQQQLGFLQALFTRSNATVHARDQLARQKTSKTNNALLQLHKHAIATYNMLNAAWGCTCISQHRADLLLRRPTTPAVRFDALLLYNSNGGHDDTQVPAPPWTKRQVNICHLSEAAVGFSDSTFGDIAMPDADVMATELPDNTPTSDLCAKLADGQQATNHLALLAGTNVMYTYALQARDPIDFATGTASVVTLQSLLRADVTKGTPRPSRKVRYGIAAALASAHVQLHSSGWLRTGWDKNAIVFLSGDNGDVHLDAPLLRRAFGWAVPRRSAGVVDFDIHLSSLAILLLELCFGVSLEEKRAKSTQAHVQINAVHDRVLAMTWAEEVAEEAGPEYSAAVWWCLEKAFVRADDLVWRRDFINMVVAPLRLRYQRLCEPNLNM